MSVCRRAHLPDEIAPASVVIVDESHPRESPEAVRLRNYRVIDDGDAPPQARGKFASAFEVLTISPPRAKILELLRPDDPGKDALEAIVRPNPRRGLARPYDEDTKRFLQRTLLAPTDSSHDSEDPEQPKSDISDAKTERSLADELREAEEDERSGASLRRELLREFCRRGGGVREAMERDRLGRLALSVEEDEEEECGLSAAARRLDALLAESRSLHAELAGIHEDIQVQSARAGQCAEAARALTAESLALRYLDDIVALLRGDVTAARRTSAWPFAFGRRQPERNYIV